MGAADKPLQSKGANKTLNRDYWRTDVKDVGEDQILRDKSRSLKQALLLIIKRSVR